MRHRSNPPHARETRLQTTLRLRTVTTRSEPVPALNGSAPMMTFSARWRVELRRQAIALLEERRYEELLGVLCSAREQHPYDLEILRSIRVLEHHLIDDHGEAA